MKNPNEDIQCHREKLQKNGSEDNSLGRNDDISEPADENYTE